MTRQELAPTQYAGCQGINGPVPPPFLIIIFKELVAFFSFPKLLIPHKSKKCDQGVRDSH